MSGRVTKRSGRGGRMGAVVMLGLLLVAVLAVGLLLAVRDAPPHQPVFFGVSDSDALRDGSVFRAAGRPAQVVNVFVKLDSDFSTRILLDRAELAAGATGVLARGAGLRPPVTATPMVTLEPWSWRSRWGQTDLPQYRLSTITDGRHDAALNHLARAVAAFPGQVLLRFAHEMNGWWYPWAQGVNGNRPGDYVKAWDHVQEVFAAAGAANVRWVWAPNALLTGGSSLAGLFPGDSRVDYVGYTSYGHRASASADLDPTYRALTALSSRPVLLAETGADGAGQAAWIRSLAAWMLDAPRLSGFVWFPTNRDAGASGNYRFDDSPSSSAAMRALLASVSKASRRWAGPT